MSLADRHEDCHEIQRRPSKFPGVKKFFTKLKSKNLEKISFEDSVGGSSITGGGSDNGGDLKALAPTAKTPQHVTGNAFGSDASKLLLSLRKKSLKRAVSFKDPFGSNILHLACYNGASAESIRFILSSFTPAVNEALVQEGDKEGRTPLQLCAECICRNKIDLKEGMAVIQILNDVDTNIVHHMDHNKKTVLDIVFCSLRHIHSQSEECKNLMMVYTLLRDLNKNAYIAKKLIWEQEPYDKTFPLDDDRTLETSSLCDTTAHASIAMATIGTEYEPPPNFNRRNFDQYTI